MATSIFNCWGFIVAVGARVTTAPYGGHSGKVRSIDCTSNFARAYGPQVRLDCGITVGVDDCMTFRQRLQSHAKASDCHDLTMMTALLHTSRDFTARAEQMARIGLQPSEWV